MSDKRFTVQCTAWFTHPLRLRNHETRYLQVTDSGDLNWLAHAEQANYFTKGEALGIELALIANNNETDTFYSIELIE